MGARQSKAEVGGAADADADTFAAASKNLAGLSPDEHGAADSDSGGSAPTATPEQQSRRRPRTSVLSGRPLNSAAARETNAEREYRVLYSGLLAKIGNLKKSERGVGGGGGVGGDKNGDNGNGDVDEAYKAENDIFEKASTSLMYAAAGGVGVGLMAFVSMRYIPTMLSRMIGGDATLVKLREKNAATSGLQKGGMFLFELSFGFWAGWRGYHVVTEQMGKGGGYDEIAKIPLVQGRSAISDCVCDDWIQLTYDTVPPEFWHNLTHGEEDCKLKDYRAWEAIRAFAHNCETRSRFEDELRREGGLEGDAPVAIPPPGVPEHFGREEDHPLTEEEASVLVQDAPRGD